LRHHFAGVFSHTGVTSMHSELSSQDLQTRLMPAVHGETSYSKGPQGVHSEQIVSVEPVHPPSTK
jgi:hypothetical protein